MTWRNPPSSVNTTAAPRLKSETEEYDQKDHAGAPVEVLRVRLSTNVPFPSRTVRLECDRPLVMEASRFNFEYEGIFFNTPAGHATAVDPKTVTIHFDSNDFQSNEALLVAELASAGGRPKLVGYTFT
jgi:hypothetical protein